MAALGNFVVPYSSPKLSRKHLPTYSSVYVKFCPSRPMWSGIFNCSHLKPLGLVGAALLVFHHSFHLALFKCVNLVQPFFRCSHQVLFCRGSKSWLPVNKVAGEACRKVKWLTLYCTFTELGGTQGWKLQVSQIQFYCKIKTICFKMHTKQQIKLPRKAMRSQMK